MFTIKKYKKFIFLKKKTCVNEATIYDFIIYHFNLFTILSVFDKKKLVIYGSLYQSLFLINYQTMLSIYPIHRNEVNRTLFFFSIHWEKWKKIFTSQRKQKQQTDMILKVNSSRRETLRPTSQERKKKHKRERERERGRPENVNKIHHRRSDTLLLLRKHT